MPSVDPPRPVSFQGPFSGSPRGRLALRGFTLSELLVVLLVVSVLLALVLPGMQRAIRSVRRTQCVNNLRGVGVALRLYTLDHRQRFPPANSQNAVAAELGWSGFWFAPSGGGTRGLARYVGGQQALDQLTVCPENRFRSPDHPSTKNPTGFPYCASYNALRPSGVAKLVSTTAMAARAELSKVVILGDSAVTDPFAGTAWSLGTYGPSTDAWKFMANRHASGLNILWADGHVTSTSKEALTATQFPAIP
ncbi:MAG TPA: prepilin-type N-terminal cleavage/methylation domain-containing protein [Chthoniobacteraceae bacterium]|nr:prepilin-type N-terminal cleavage/methylation domain-containing protein [Chthoniobacteraceae bacterium]